MGLCEEDIKAGVRDHADRPEGSRYLCDLEARDQFVHLTLLAVDFKLKTRFAFVGDVSPVGNFESASCPTVDRRLDLIARKVSFVGNVHLASRIQDFCMQDVLFNILGGHVHLTLLSFNEFCMLCRQWIFCYHS